MEKKFAILVDETRKSLVKRKISSKDLQLLFKQSKGNKFYEWCKEEIEITELFLKFCDYWSFFDYEYLSMLIKRFCKKLVHKLEQYESAFKSYCKNRVVEVPADMFKGKGTNAIFVKCDKSFEKVTLEDIKKLQNNLSVLLNANLFLVKVSDGCTELVFDTMSPLTKSQRSQLSEMGVLKIMYSVHYHNTESLPSHSALPTEKPAMGIPSGVQSTSDPPSLLHPSFSDQMCV